MTGPTPNYLSVADVIALYDVAMQESGQSPTALVRPEALQSAVHHPRNLGYYADAGIAEQAVELMIHIAVAHAWVDGNKRIATLTLYIFLTRNEIRIPGEPALRSIADLLVDWLSAPRDKRSSTRDAMIQLVESWIA